MKQLTLLIIFFIATINMLYSQSWETLYNELRNHYNNATYQQGISLHKKVLDKAEKEFGKTHDNYAATLTTLGHLYNLTTNYQQAGLLYEQALFIYKNNYGERHINYAVTCINLANVWKSLGKYHAAEPLYIQALSVYKSQYGDKSNEYLGYSYYLGQLYDLMGKYDEAEEIYKKILSVYQLVNNGQNESYAGYLFALGQLYEKAVRYPEAEKAYKEAAEIYKNLSGESGAYYFYTLNFLAHLYLLNGNYAEAEINYKQSFQLCSKNIGAKNEHCASILNNMANLYKNMGRLADAENAYNQVAAIYREILGEEHSHYATTLNNLAILYVEYGEIQKAQEYYYKAAEIYKKSHGEEHPYYAIALVNLGQMHLSVADYKTAEEFYVKASQIFKKTLGEKHPDYAETLNALGLVYKNMGDHQQALELYLKSLAVQEEKLGPYHPLTGSILTNLASLYEHTNQLKEAEDVYKKLIGNLTYQIHHYFPSISEKEKEAFYGTIKGTFERFNSFAIRRMATNPDIVAQVYENQLLTKAMLLNSSNKIRNSIMNSGDKELISLYKEWKFKKESLGKTFSMTKEEMTAHHISQEVLVSEANELERTLSLKSESFSQLLGERATWKDLQMKLKPGEVAVEMLRFRKYTDDWADTIQYAALVLKDKKNPVLILFSNGNEMEDKYYTYYRNAVKLGLDDQLSYKQYWLPLSNALQGIQKVYFSPDGVYHKISLHTLKSSADQYLLDEADIYLVSSTRELLKAGSEVKIENMATAKAHLLGFPDYNGMTTASSVNHSVTGTVTFSRDMKDSLSRFFSGGNIPELKGTKEEVTGIIPLLKAKNITSEVHLGTEASEEYVKSISNSCIIHIATHGFFLQDTDFNAEQKQTFAGMSVEKVEENALLRSGLLLAGAKHALSGTVHKGKEDGMLTAFEVMNLDLSNTTLVTLSACETGLGEIKNGEGVYGLQRAFQIAGTRYIIMSLWKVDDRATQELMVNFYAKWLSGMEIHKALKEAQKEIRTKYKSAYYWGAFVLSGV